MMRKKCITLKDEYYGITFYTNFRVWTYYIPPYTLIFSHFHPTSLIYFGFIVYLYSEYLHKIHCTLLVNILLYVNLYNAVEENWRRLEPWKKMKTEYQKTDRQTDRSRGDTIKKWEEEQWRTRVMNLELCIKKIEKFNCAPISLSVCLSVSILSIFLPLLLYNMF